MIVLELLNLKMEVTVSEPCDVIRVASDHAAGHYECWLCRGRALRVIHCASKMTAEVPPPGVGIP